MVKRWFVCMTALAALAVTGCQLPHCPPPAERPLSMGCVSSCSNFELDRGDWEVSRRTAVWKVQEARENRPPETIGYVTRRMYRQMRGGPEYSVYVVTTMNRNETIGRIDQMGRAWRFEPRRNAGFEEVDLGATSMENGVGKIFQTRHQVTLEQTSERRLAFEAFDRNGNGALEADEVEPHGDPLRRADTNGDGKVDFGEFDAIPRL